MKTNKNTFQEAFALIKNPETWTQGYYARRADGSICFSSDDDACQWCSIGACNKVDPFREHGILDAVAKVAMRKSHTFLHYFNDRSSHAEVVAAWEEAGLENGWLDE